MSITAETLNLSIESASLAGVVEHFIDGKFVPSASGETFDDINPATGAVIAKVASGNAADVDKAVGAARRAFERGVWRKMALKERCAILHKVGDIILQYRQLLAE